MRKARIISNAARSQSALQPKSVPVRSGSQLRTAIVWCSLGFISGAAFWHLVGFWSFMSEVVLDRTPSANAAVVSRGPQRTTVDQPPIVVVDTNRCTMLTLDRRTNNTVSQPCPTTSLALRFKPVAGVREDMAAVAQPQLQAVGYRAN